MSSSDKVRDFEEYFQQVAAKVKDISDLNLSSDKYDAVFTKSLRTTNLLNKQGSTSKQSHIAITGKSRDIFPYINIASYTDVDGDNAFKSFYVLKVKMTFYLSNFEYAKAASVGIFAGKSSVDAGVSVKLSRPNNGPQIELGNTTQSDENSRVFRELFDEGDVLVLLKRKEQLHYDAFILRKDDVGDLPIDCIGMLKGKTVTTLVDEDSFEFSSQTGQDIPKAVTGGKNVIFYGAPGTGKSYGIKYFIRENGLPDYDPKVGNPLVFRVTLHPEYDYSDLVGQLRPSVKENDRVTYELAPGVFTSALKKAVENPDKHVFLIMEEMSRSNVAAVFGDLFQLLDRDATGRSQYSINNELLANKVFGIGPDQANDFPVFLPSNLTIIGTVNTNDQNVFVMDTAFKRRFLWKYVSTNTDLAHFTNNAKIEIATDYSIDWAVFYQSLNHFIVADLGLAEDKQIGPYFINFQDEGKVDENGQPVLVDRKQATELVRDKLLQYLWEDVAKVAQNTFVDKKLFDDQKISCFADLYDKFGHEQVFSKEFVDELGIKAAKVKKEADFEHAEN
ncbi:AAA family ATPase [Lactobacillus delbrueckii subsp. bulgaricus]